MSHQAFRTTRATRVTSAAAVHFIFGCCLLFPVAAVQAQPPGQPFELLQRQVRDLQEQLTLLSGRTSELESQIEESQEIIADQHELIEILRSRMVFEEDQWRGWENMTLHGTTRFTNDQDAGVVEIGVPGQPLLVVGGDLHLEGTEENPALFQVTNGRARILAVDPTRLGESAFEVYGRSAFYHNFGQEPRVVINSGTNELNPINNGLYVVGPVALTESVEAAEERVPRTITFFQSPNQPIALQQYPRTVFAVWLSPTGTHASVQASDFWQISED